MNRWLALAVFGIGSVLVVSIFTLWLRPKTPAAGTSSSQTLTEPTVTFVNPALGPASAKAVFVLFGDLACEACHEVLQNLLLLAERRPLDVRIIWKNMPNDSAHPEATSAAVAAHCADRQQKFWPFVELLRTATIPLGTELYASTAQNLGLNLEAFARCVDDRDTLPIIRKDVEEGNALGIDATPTVFVNGQRVVGAVTLEELERYVLEAQTRR
jgi:protein-disulfide isomerase